LFRTSSKLKALLKTAQARRPEAFNRAGICNILLPMRKAIFFVSLIGVFTLTLGAQDDEATFQTYMKTVAANFGQVRNAADNAAAKAPATTLAETFEKVAAFWKAHKAPDAVMIAENARDAAKAIADGTGDKAANTMKLQAQCGACHMAHREGAAPNYKIKY
jgi:hypothetical protein